MENWRRYIKEEFTERLPGGLGVDYPDEESAPFDSAEPTQKQLTQQISGADIFKPLIEFTKELAVIFEPTGQIYDLDIDTGKITTTYEELKSSAKQVDLAWEKGDYVTAGISSATAALLALAMIPFFGKIPKAAAAITSKARKISKSLKLSREPKFIKITRRIDSEINSVTKKPTVKSITKSAFPKLEEKAGRTLQREKSGILIDPDGRAMVVVVVDGEKVMFLKGSGTSQSLINKTPEGLQMQPFPREWYPLDGTFTGITYPKVKSSDPRMGLSSQNRQHPKYNTDTIVRWDNDFDDQMTKDFGKYWPLHIHDGDYISGLVVKAYKEGRYTLPRVPPGKWPHPDSQFGEIAKQISAAEAAGQLEKVFGQKHKFDTFGRDTVLQMLDHFEGKISSKQLNKNNP